MELLKNIGYYYSINGQYVLEQFFRHFLISIYGVLFASLIAIPLGFYLARHSKMADWVIGIANVIQTIPALALMSLLMLAIGLGTKTIIITVMLYSLLPIIKNTYTGVKNIDTGIIDSAKGMGMTKWQMTYMVEFPLAISMIMAGIRNALVVGIGVTAIGTFIGAGGLGDIISRGISVANGSAIILAGAIPTAVMAVITDLLLGKIERALTPKEIN